MVPITSYVPDYRLTLTLLLSSSTRDANNLKNKNLHILNWQFLYKQSNIHRKDREHSHHLHSLISSMTIPLKKKTLWISLSTTAIKQLLALSMLHTLDCFYYLIMIPKCRHWRRHDQYIYLLHLLNTPSFHPLLTFGLIKTELRQSGGWKQRREGQVQTFIF